VLIWISYKACQVGLDRWLSRQPSPNRSEKQESKAIPGKAKFEVLLCG